MSHNIKHFIYAGNVNKNDVQCRMDNYVAHEDWQESCSGLLHKIRWIDTVCASEDEATRFIENHDMGNYDSLAVRFICSDPLRKYEQKSAEAEASLKEAKTEINYPATRKSEFIGCPGCSSRLNREILAGSKKPNRCPLCGADLRPETSRERDQARLEKARAVKKKADEALEKAKKRLIADKTGKYLRWLVKIEYHT